MLYLQISEDEHWDAEKEEFIYPKVGPVYRMEYSLKAIADWETEYAKPLLTTKMTIEEQLYFFRCMCLDEPFSTGDLNQKAIDDIGDYMNKNTTATKVKKSNQSPNTSIMTSEVIYAYLSALEIPYSCETWNIRRLFMLIEVRSEHKNPSEKKKMTQKEINDRNKALNAERRKKYNTKG